MFKKLKLLFFAGLLGCLVTGCVNTIDVTEDVFKTIEESFAFDADGGTKSFVLQTSVGWTATTDTDWCTVTPTKGMADMTGVNVKVKVTTNTGTTSRAAVVTVTPDTDALPVVNITVTQDGAAKTLCVWDIDNYVALDDYVANLDYIADSTALYIKSNVDWSLSSGPDWIDVVIPDEKSDITTVTLKYDTNIGDARNGDLTFTADDIALTIPVVQAATLAFDITNITADHPYINADLKVVPSGGLDSETHYWYYICATTAAVDKRGGADAYANTLLGAYNAYMTSYDESQLFYSTDKVLSYDSLLSDTEYQLIVFGVCKRDGVFVPTTAADVFAFKTAVAPDADEGYLNIIGDYAIDVYDYYDSKSAEVECRDTLVLSIKQKYVNESYTVSFADGNFSPVSGSYVDTFVGTYSDGTITIANNQYSDLGAAWKFSFGYAWCLFYVGWTATEEDIDALVLTPVNDNINLMYTNTAPTEDDSLYIQCLLMDEDGEETGYAYSLYIFDEASLPTRIVTTDDNTTTSLLGVKAVGDTDLIAPKAARKIK